MMDHNIQQPFSHEMSHTLSPVSDPAIAPMDKCTPRSRLISSSTNVVSGLPKQKITNSKRRNSEQKNVTPLKMDRNHPYKRRQPESIKTSCSPMSNTILDKTPSKHSRTHQRSGRERVFPTMYEISDDEDLTTGPQNYERALKHLKDHEPPSGPGSSLSAIEVISDDEGEDVEDSAPFSALPIPFRKDNDIEIIQTITRRQSDLPTEFVPVNQVRGVGRNGQNYNCVPGKCFELTDGDFIKVERLVQDKEGKTWIIGLLFRRCNDLIDSRRWPRRHNELVHMIQVKNGCTISMEKRPVEQIVRHRQLILTNHSFPTTSSVDHRDSCSNIADDKMLGPLFCRWQQTHVCDAAGKIVEQSIEKLSYAAADDRTSTVDATVRWFWRRKNTKLGGESTDFKAVVTDDGEDVAEIQRYVFGDAFCGAGGASCGALEAGLFVKFGVDLDEKAMQTYRLNFAPGGTDCRCEDIHDFLAQMKPDHYFVDVLHVSPPCQPFSAAHTIKNQLQDEKNEAAMFAVGELLRKLKPRIVTLEETYGLFNRHPDWSDALMRMFIDAGYSIRWTGAKLEEYGLPQKRRRLLIIAAGPGETLPKFPAITHSATDPSLRPLTTIEEAISGIPERSSISHHDIQAAKYDPSQYKMPYSANTQAKTITTSGGIGNHHPSGERMFTMRELAALQRFPSTYEFADVGVTWLRRQIGNAVPPYIFKKFYREIIKSLKESDGVN